MLLPQIKAYSFRTLTNRATTLVSLCLALAVFPVAAVAADAQQDGREQPPDTSTLPEFHVFDEAQQPISSHSWLGDKPLLVDFWATWCRPCQVTLPEIEMIHRDYRDRIEVYGIAVDSGLGGGLRARNFARDGGVTYEILHDLKAEARKATGVNVLPVLYLYDGDGNLVQDWWGEPDFLEVRERIDELVGPAPEEPEAEADENEEATR